MKTNNIASLLIKREKKERIKNSFVFVLVGVWLVWSGRVWCV